MSNLDTVIKSSILLSNPAARVVFNAVHGRVVGIFAESSDAESAIVDYAEQWGIVASIVAPIDIDVAVAVVATRDPALDFVVVRPKAKAKALSAGSLDLFKPRSSR